MAVNVLRFIYDSKFRQQSTFTEFFLLMWEVSKDWRALAANDVAKLLHEAST